MLDWQPTLGSRGRYSWGLSDCFEVFRRADLTRFGAGGRVSFSSFCCTNRERRAGLAHRARVERGPLPKKLDVVLKGGHDTWVEATTDIDNGTACRLSIMRYICLMTHGEDTSSDFFVDFLHVSIKIDPSQDLAPPGSYRTLTDAWSASPR